MTISTHCQTAARAVLGLGIVVTLAVLPAIPADAGVARPDHAAGNGGQRGPSQVGQRQGEAPARQTGHPHVRDRAPKAAPDLGPASHRPPRRNVEHHAPPGLNRGAGARAWAHGRAGPPGRPPHARGHDDVEAPEEPDADAPSPPVAAPAPSTERTDPVASETAEPLFLFARASGPAGPPRGAESADPTPVAPAAPPTPAPPPRSAMDHALGLLPEPGDALPPLRDPTVPMLLIVALAAYALVVARGDRRDPKLARSSVDQSRGLGFK